jgi:carbohydrate-selective porin OprB
LISEVFYKLDVADFLAVTPSLQYVNNPPGSEVENSVLFGLRVGVDF